MNIDKYSREPIYEQIINQIESLIIKGALKKNEQLPSVRALSQEIPINQNTIQKPYRAR